MLVEMWAAHVLTLMRLPLALALTLVYGRPGWAVAVIAAAALTDALDGTVARRAVRRGATGPDIGGWLDPLVDKVFVAIALATIWDHSGDALVVALIAARELLLAPLLVVFVATGHDASRLRAAPIGKAATIAQFVALSISIVAPTWSRIAAIPAAILGVAAIADYLRRVGLGTSRRRARCG